MTATCGISGGRLGRARQPLSPQAKPSSFQEVGSWSVGITTVSQSDKNNPETLVSTYVSGLFFET